LPLDPAGLVGIGTTSPGAKLNVWESTGANLFKLNGLNSYNLDIANNYDNGTRYDFNVGSGAGAFSFSTSAGERVRIDSSGRLLVGTSSSRTGYKFETEGTASNNSWASFSHNSNDVIGAILKLLKSRGTAVGSNTIVQSGDIVGRIDFDGTDGSVNQTAAQIYAVIDGTPGAADMPGRLVFSTTADGASSPTERMRIDSSGTVLIGVNTKIIAQTTNPFVFFQAQATTTTSGLTIESYGNNIATRYHFGFTNPNGVVGTISTNGSATAYNTSSDYRLKENVVPLTGAVDRVNQLQVHRFNFIADPDKIVDGFIAHEAQAVVPECVTGTKDEVDEDGNPVYQGIDQSKLVPLLTAALQEALAEIESLKARVTALEP